MNHTPADYVLGFIALAIHGLLVSVIGCGLLVLVGFAKLGELWDWSTRTQRRLY